MRKLLALLLMTSMLATAYGQTKSVSGKITDPSGTPLPSISVTIKGTSSGTTTGADGSFKLSVPENATLVFSGIGYESTEMSVRNRTVFDIQLSAEIKSLSEIVVTGTGVATEKKKLSIDVASVGNKDMAKSAILSIDQALIGKVAGANIQSLSGEPGQKPNIILRGINSLGSTNPIILVDGVQVTDINGLDVSNVEKVEVAKGPSAGMLYGAQGANGVIQIFTKKGSKNKPLSITLASKVSIDNVILGEDKTLSAKLHHFQQDANGNILDRNGDVLKPDSNGMWPEPAEEDFNTDFSLKNNKTYPANLPLYDHLEQAYQTATSTINSLGISGGGNKTDYSFTLSHIDQENVLNNHLRRTNLSANLGFELFKGFTARNNTQLILQDENLLSGTYNVTSRMLFNVDDLFKGTNNNRFEMINSYPWIDFTAKYPGSDLVVVRPRDENQLNVLSEPDWHSRYSKDNRVINNSNLNYKFPRFVELDFKYGIELWNSEFQDLYKNQEASPQVDLGFWGNTALGSVRDDHAKSTYQNALSTIYVRLDFNKDFKIDLPITTTTQFSYDWRKLEYNSFFSQGVNLPQYPPANISAAGVKTSGDGSLEYITFGYLVNQTIDFGNLFGATGGLRSDYNSQFGDQKSPFTFGRATAYFRPSELLKINVLNDWKVRAAYGAAGIPPNEFDGNYYSRQTTLSSQQLGSGVGLYLPNIPGNPKLQVQEVKEMELGTDVTILPGTKDWFNRISLSATYWKKNNNNNIQYVDQPASSGFQQTVENLIDLTVKGADISLDANMYSSKKVDWTMAVRFGTFKTKVDRVANGRDFVNGLFIVKEGESLGNFYTSNPLTSIDQTRQSDKSRYIPEANASQYEVANGVVVNKTTKRSVLTDANDQYITGNAYPKFTMSFTNNVMLWQKLSVSMQWDWSHGNDIYNLTKQWMYRDRLHKDFDKSLTINGETGSFVNFYNSMYNSVQRTGWFVEDGSYWRMRDLTLIYQLGDLIKDKASWVKGIAVTVSGRNLLTITDYSGLDPEATSAQDSQGNRSVGAGSNIGADYFSVPNLRSFQFGLNLQF
ncbi:MULTISPECIES: SusC/RagA family TonB-linked outer membrane protein [Niastella]|uniref:SusC/RagA family TonB-linked outer membrane protein n=1 Tax=Niastella soli TaxID=2821487 RepID=A0ABS3YT12_9BACT|nr:SusC/RagA family TonB-linked outer membrane protein [Niastella soli]MBO9201003.1 SusC/RagA family TonB-linked outer membrane protein [Niastella soli]